MKKTETKNVGSAAAMLCWVIILGQNIGFGILALLAELNGISWLAIIFVIFGFLTLSTPVLKRIKDHLEEEE